MPLLSSRLAVTVVGQFITRCPVGRASFAGRRFFRVQRLGLLASRPATHAGAQPVRMAATSDVGEKMAALQVDGDRPGSDLVAPYSRMMGRTIIKDILTAEGKGKALVGRTVTVGGWVKSGREQGKGAFAFLELNDGSMPTNLQVIVEKEVHALRELVHTGTCVVVEGTLTPSPAQYESEQAVELKATKVLFVGPCDPGTYPIAKIKLGLEFLRGHLHLRMRTNLMSSVARIRNALSWATHSFFQKHGFFYVHTPIVTSSDCEGAGEMFQVTTLLSAANAAAATAPPSAADVAALSTEVSAAGSAVKVAKAAAKDAPESADAAAAAKDAVDRLLALKTRLAETEVASRAVGGLPRTAEGRVDYSTDFFSRAAFLTVSGQLQGESYACSLSSIYTFGPTFRAENSNTTRHLAEFWMIEPELAFADLNDDMNCAEDYVRFCCKHLLEECAGDMAFIAKYVDKGAVERLQQVVSTPFVRITYTRAVEMLLEAIAGGKVFDNPVEWGVDLQSEHERYITEVLTKAPTIVYNYPKGIKSFYMRLNEDGKTVAAMDLLVPKVGELVGGSQREERPDVLEQRIREVGLDPKLYDWYLDLRRFGTVPHAGFGLGFERLILFATGVENIRDVIPFPRFPGKCDL